MSSKPRIQRFERYNAPMHIRQHFLHVHVDKSLREKMPVKRRAIQIAKGDTVKIMSGAKRGTTGKVLRVSLRTGRVFLDSLKKKNARGKEFNIGISSSNVYITELNLSDKRRADKLKLKQTPKQKEQQEEKPAPEKKTDKAAESIVKASAGAMEKIQHDAQTQKGVV